MAPAHVGLPRTFSVRFTGLGFCRPIASLITLIIAYARLKRNGITPWDREGRFAVIHERFGAARLVVVIGLLLLCSVLTVVGSLAEMA